MYPHKKPGKPLDRSFNGTFPIFAAHYRGQILKLQPEGHKIFLNSFDKALPAIFTNELAKIRSILRAGLR